LYSTSSLSGKQRLSPLPSFSSAVHEKHHLTSSSREHHSSWITRVELPIPGVTSRRLKLIIPLPPRLLGVFVPPARSGRKRSGVMLAFMALLFIWTVFALTKRFATRSKTWPQPFSGDPPTLVYERADLRRIWLWEIASGHYPSNRPRKKHFRDV
jgi:DDB1- and CUL4-associated factor 13